jgi:hypothetical protein
MTPLQEGYAALAAGDPLALSYGIPPRIVALATAARRQRAAVASQVASAARAPASIAASAIAPAPRPSRAAEIAAIHLAGVNDSRKRAGLAPLTSAELATEFAELDRLSTNTTTKKSARRAAANAMAARQGLPTDQAAIDSRWAAAAQKLNATLAPAAPSPTPSPRPPRAHQSQAEIDATWSSIVTDLNKQAGLATPARAR